MSAVIVVFPSRAAESPLKEWETHSLYLLKIVPVAGGVLSALPL